MSLRYTDADHGERRRPLKQPWNRTMRAMKLQAHEPLLRLPIDPSPLSSFVGIVLHIPVQHQQVDVCSPRDSLPCRFVLMPTYVAMKQMLSDEENRRKLRLARDAPNTQPDMPFVEHSSQHTCTINTSTSLKFINNRVPMTLKESMKSACLDGRVHEACDSHSRCRIDFGE